jgi:hypothetical protein
MKTLFGITFEQLHGLTVEELQDYTIAFTINASRQSMALAELPLPATVLQKYQSSANKKLASVVQTFQTDEYYDILRKLYDTQERFDLAATLSDQATEISQAMQKMVQELTEDMLRFLDEEEVR